MVSLSGAAVPAVPPGNTATLGTLRGGTASEAQRWGPTKEDVFRGELPPGFVVTLTDGREWKCARLIVATGGLCYPSTGSSGDGIRWAEALGHRIVPTFPSLTALVPKGYKQLETKDLHIDRNTPLTEFGQSLCGVQLKNVQLSLLIEGTEAGTEFGDVDFTDGGLEGPVGYQLSRKAVKAMVNGSRVSELLDLKPGVSLTELTVRVKELWAEIEKDPR